jgi:hypothetical protein
MPKIVIIDKSGTVKTNSVKDFAEDTLYKKVGFKTSEGFGLQHTWGAEDGLDHLVKLYAKKTGRAGQENKYDFPPPVDNTLFFGSCALVGYDAKTKEVVDLDEDDWEEIYDYLFGGFEDIHSSDEDDEDDVDTEDELQNIQQQSGGLVKQTKQGYVKDGFIVDDDDEDEDVESDTETLPVKRKTVSKKPVEKPIVEQDVELEECESELSEESYV